jgi:hypothetical protein
MPETIARAYAAGQRVRLYGDLRGAGRQQLDALGAEIGDLIERGHLGSRSGGRRNQLVARRPACAGGSLRRRMAGSGTAIAL